MIILTQVLITVFANFVQIFFCAVKWYWIREDFAQFCTDAVLC